MLRPLSLWSRTRAASGRPEGGGRVLYQVQCEKVWYESWKTARKKYTLEQVVALLRQFEVASANGKLDHTKMAGLLRPAYLRTTVASAIKR